MRRLSWLVLLIGCVLGIAVRAPAAVDVKGIDISHWQGTINWTSVKTGGYKFAFMKATQGNSYNDPTFNTNISNATAQGIRVGPYHFCDLNTDTANPLDPINEANHFLAIIKPKYKTGMYLPPVADVEGFPTGMTTAELKALTSTWVQVFSDTIYNSLGVRPIIYTSKSKANSYYTTSVAGSHELWLAWWKGTGTTSPPVASDTPAWGIWQFWQWSDGSDATAQASPVPGISGNVDRDAFYGTQAQLDALRIGYDGAITGDFNRDGKVDSGDYLLWRKTKGQIVPIYSGADANGDAKVDNSDYSLWRAHFGQSSGTGAGSSLHDGAVPEPAAGILAILAGGWAFLCRRRTCRRRFLPPAVVGVALALVTIFGGSSQAAVSSVSAWDAADFRIWGFVPYWVSSSTLNAFPADGVYSHVSDVLYFGGVRPKIDGGLHYISGATTELNTLKSHAAANGFRLHMSMFEVYDPASNNDFKLVWDTIAASPTLRATFVNNVKNLLQTNNMKGFNFDYERPFTDGEWANYTQLAKDMRAAINPLDMEISVDDYGSTDSDWDDTAVFDAAAYDQLFIMGYHYGASSNATFANGKLALTAQGADKAFKNEQLVLGVGTWGTGPSTKTLRDIVAATPNLAYNAGTWSDGTNTWTIESREQVRAKTQLALDRNMPGMMSWTLHYDATNNMSLHRVMHHYMAVKRGAPDLNLDGKVNVTDATALANNMGMVLTNTGMTTAPQFDAFYLAGNWEKGDRDGNGFVNQSDADWLAGRYTSLGVTLPDRLAYSGTFEIFTNTIGVTGRWRAGRNAQNALMETSNFAQNGSNYLSWSGTGVGASKWSNSFVTIRNQNSSETAAGINSQTRTMQADLATSIDLGQDQDTYVTFLVRENTAPLSASQLASSNRVLTLDFLNSAGATQFDFAFRGLQNNFGIDSVADSLGQDIVSTGFNSNATFLFVGKISGNGSGANLMQASLFSSGAVVADFTQPDFQWMLTAQGSASFNPIITELLFTSRSEANFTVSNVWIGSAAALIPPTPASQGDFNDDGVVDSRDYVVWRNTVGQTGPALAADGNGNYQIDTGDYNVWRVHFGQPIAGSGTGFDSAVGVPEPHSACILATVGIMLLARRRRAKLR